MLNVKCRILGEQYKKAAFQKEYRLLLYKERIGAC